MATPTCIAMHEMPLPKSKGETLHRKRKIITKNYLHVLSCLDTRKNQRKSRLKSPTRWVPRGRNCHAILFATPAAWLIWYRLLGPPPRSTPDPLPGLAFMPLLASSAPCWLRNSINRELQVKRDASASSAWQREWGSQWYCHSELVVESFMSLPLPAL